MSKHLNKGKEMFQDLKQRQKFNETINVLPASLQNKEYLGSKILLRMFQHTESPLTPQGVLKPEYLDKYSESGQPQSKLNPDQFKWSTRALVISVPPSAKKFMEENWEGQTIEPGDIVDLDLMAKDPRNQIPIDRTSPMFDFSQGFMRLHPTAIDFKYDSPKLELTYEQV